MKAVLGKIFGHYLVWAIGIIGFPLLFWITWVQSVGFQYVDLSNFVFVFAITCFFGVIAVRYVRRSQHAKMKDIKHMLISDVVCFILCVIISYTAYNVAYYYLGLGGMGFCLGNIWYYLFWLRDEQKKEAESEAKAG